MNLESQIFAKISQPCAVHLIGWIHTQFPQSRDAVFRQMAKFLIKQDDEDIPNLMDLGWWKVYDMMKLWENKP